MPLALRQLHQVSLRGKVLLMRIVLLLLLISHERRHESSLLSQLVPVRLQAMVGTITSTCHHRWCMILQYFSFMLSAMVLGSLVLDVELIARLAMCVADYVPSLLVHLKSILHCGVQQVVLVSFLFAHLMLGEARGLQLEQSGFVRGCPSCIHLHLLGERRVHLAAEVDVES